MRFPSRSAPAGSGLNLAAADRAYRTGQTRYVTIYRLVTRGVIEEQIIELHRSKG
ncbi:MAG: hypothetical protein OYK82_13420 [Gammaproteobacteria bacterium]|nr:hypothetical protein [Gammaproteobacteria bacterium]